MKYIYFIHIFSFLLVTDRAKIEILPSLINLSINQNPLGTIPSFNNTKIDSLSLQDTSLISAEFPSCYENSLLQTVSLSINKIRSIKESDFLVLRNSPLKKFHLNSASISTIDQNAFAPLTQLQSLSLQDNQLKSCEFLTILRSLSSIKLDGNLFTSLPEQLSTPGKIKTYTFTRNSITVIDELSPLSKWVKMNYTNMKISLVDNPFNCCLSLWFIRLLKTSPQLVDDASLLTCATPINYKGKFLIELNPDEMNCSGDKPNKTWWTTARIIIIISIGAVIIAVAIGLIVFRCFLRHRLRTGYLPIGEGNEDHYSTIDPSISGGPAFPVLDDDYDGLSTHTYDDDMRSIFQSEAPTQITAEAIYAADGSQAGGSEIQEAALIPNIH